MKIFAICFSLAVTFFVRAACPGAVGEWVTAGNDGMFETRVAEDLPCRSAQEFDTTPVDPMTTTLQNRILSNLDLRNAIATLQPVEITRCRFTSEVDLTGLLQQPIVFRQCEFEGNVTVRSAQTASIEFSECLFHQNVSFAGSTIGGPLTFANSVLTSHLTIETSTLASGIRATASRFTKAVTMRDVNTSAGLFFQGCRYVDNFELIELESSAGVRFKDCGFDSTSLISIDGGNIASGLRFDSCTFANRWRNGNDNLPAHMKISDVTLGAALVLGKSDPKSFPTIAVSRSVIPFLKVPEWSVVQSNLLSGSSGLDDPRQMEDAAELLQLIRRGYEADGRRRDAESVRRHYELLIARIRGGPTLWIRTGVAYFGWAMTLALLTILGVALTLAWNANSWNLVSRQRTVMRLMPWAVILSLQALVGAVPDKVTESAEPAGRWMFRITRTLGLLLSFLFGIIINEWVHV